MLYATYRSLQRWDAAQPGRISHGSMVERISGRVIVDGLWTSWLGDDASDLPSETAAQRPATRRVQFHMEQIQDARASPQQALAQDATSVAFATGLPTAAVAQALTDLDAKRTPGGDEADHRTLPGMTDELTGAESALRIACRALFVIQAVIAIVSFVLALDGALDAPSAVVLMTQSLLMASVAAVVVSDPRRAAALVPLIVGAQIAEAIAALVVLGTVDVAESPERGALYGDRTALTGLALANLLMALVLMVLYRVFGPSRALEPRVPRAGSHRTAAAVAEVVHGRTSTITAAEVASNVDAFLAGVRTRWKHVLRQQLVLLKLGPLLRRGRPCR